MPRPGLRSCVVESAKWICERVTEHGGEQPCSACIWSVSQMHAQFLRSLPPDLARMAPDALSSMIRSAGLDS